MGCSHAPRTGTYATRVVQVEETSKPEKESCGSSEDAAEPRRKRSKRKRRSQGLSSFSNSVEHDVEDQEAEKALESLDKRVEKLKARIEGQPDTEFRSQRMVARADTAAIPNGRKWFVEIDPATKEEKGGQGSDLVSPTFASYAQEWRASEPVDCSRSLRPGCHARIGRLHGSTDLNGKVVKLDHWDEGKQRWIVHIQNFGAKAIKPDNLSLVGGVA